MALFGVFSILAGLFFELMLHPLEHLSTSYRSFDVLTWLHLLKVRLFSKDIQTHLMGAFG